jgi:hypothetical protein
MGKQFRDIPCANRGKTDRTEQGLGVAEGSGSLSSKEILDSGLDEFINELQEEGYHE